MNYIAITLSVTFTIDSYWGNKCFKSLLLLLVVAPLRKTNPLLKRYFSRMVGCQKIAENWINILLCAGYYTSPETGWHHLKGNSILKESLSAIPSNSFALVAPLSFKSPCFNKFFWNQLKMINLLIKGICMQIVCK